MTKDEQEELDELMTEYRQKAMAYGEALLEKDGPDLMTANNDLFKAESRLIDFVVKGFKNGG